VGVRFNRVTNWTPFLFASLVARRINENATVKSKTENKTEQNTTKQTKLKAKPKREQKVKKSEGNCVKREKSSVCCRPLVIISQVNREKFSHKKWLNLDRSYLRASVLK